MQSYTSPSCRIEVGEGFVTGIRWLEGNGLQTASSVALKRGGFVCFFCRSSDGVRVSLANRSRCLRDSSSA